MTKGDVLAWDYAQIRSVSFPHGSPPGRSRRPEIQNLA
jgi:hypothetical protein